MAMTQVNFKSDSEKVDLLKMITKLLNRELKEGNSLIFYNLFVATKTFDLAARINNMYLICVTSHGGPCLNAKVQIKAKLGV